MIDMIHVRDWWCLAFTLAVAGWAWTTYYLYERALATESRAEHWKQLTSWYKKRLEEAEGFIQTLEAVPPTIRGKKGRGK